MPHRPGLCAQGQSPRLAALCLFFLTFLPKTSREKICGRSCQPLLTAIRMAALGLNRTCCRVSVPCCPDYRRGSGRLGRCRSPCLPPLPGGLPSRQALTLSSVPAGDPIAAPCLPSALCLPVGSAGVDATGGRRVEPPAPVGALFVQPPLWSVNCSLLPLLWAIGIEKRLPLSCLSCILFYCDLC